LEIILLILCGNIAYFNRVIKEKISSHVKNAIIFGHLASLRPSPMEAKGVAVWQRGVGDDASGGSRLAAARYREGTG
jgi:hypothetical protein